jgi:bacteriocin resistance YdeI/OmpD-like protein/uncharacterized protein DUF1905
VRFEATLERRGRGHVVALPFDAGKVFGQVRAPVRATIGGHTFRTTTMRYGGVDYIGLNREVREAAGVEPGTDLLVELEPDTQPREVAVPPELRRALAGDAAARAAFDSLSYTHRKEYARWIGEAKRKDTRGRRLEKAVEMLRAGVRTPG